MSTDLKPFREAIVRITTTDSTFIGVGLLLTPYVVVTCAHVVAKALGEHPSTIRAPVGKVRINCPFVDGGCYVAGTAMDEGWFPHAGSGLADIAFLRLDKKLHTPIARISSSEELDGCRFRAWVGQEGHETHLIDIMGEIGGEIANGRYRIDVRPSAYKIRPGCSGAPIVDIVTGLILGLIAQEELDEKKEAGFLIPATHLRQALAAARICLSESGTALNRFAGWVNGRYRQSSDRQRVHHIVAHYAGNAQNPMPFAGRAATLQQLDSWLAQHEQRFLLLTSPAGWGKSAVLLHWLDRVVAQRPEVSVIFVPISVRFNTSSEQDGLRLIHSSLCDIFSGLSFTESIEPSVNQYRDCLFDAWQRIANRPNRHYLLVVDGIDETANEWFYKLNGKHDVLLPKEVLPNLHILVSARHRPGYTDGNSWLADIPIRPAANPLELCRLGKPAMAEAVVQLGHPLSQLAEQEAFLDELYDLTDGGDPLLLALWAGQLWENRNVPDVTAADLRRWKPGLKGFFAYWLGETVYQVQDCHIDQSTLLWLIHVLAFARGPLLLSDLMAVLKHLRLAEAPSKAEVYSVLFNCHRLVAKAQEDSTDAETSSFVFVHSRLTDYFKDEIGQNHPGRSQQIERAYLSWGKEVTTSLNQNALPPDACPIYLLKHYTEHVIAAEETTAAPLTQNRTNGAVSARGSTRETMLVDYWLPLLERGWQQAWEARVGTWGGFLDDLGRVEHALRDFNRRSWDLGDRGSMKLASEIRLALIRSSVAQPYQPLPPQLMRELVKEEMWSIERAIRVINTFPEPENRAGCFTALASVCPASQRQQMISEAIAAAEAVQERNKQPRIFAAIAVLLEHGKQLSMLHRALEIATMIQDEGARAPVIATLAPYVKDHPVLWNQAKEAAGNLSDWHQMRALAPYSPEASRERAYLHEWDRNRNLSWPGPAGASRAEKLMEAATACQGEKQRRLLTEAFEAIGTIEDELPRSRGLTLLGRFLAQEQDLLNQVLEAANALENQACRAETLLALAPLVVKRDSRNTWLLELLKAIGSISRGDAPDPDETRLDWLADIAPQLKGNPALLRQALESLRVIEPYDIRTDALSVIAPLLAGQKELLSEALNTGAARHDEGERVGALCGLAQHLRGDETLVRQVLETIDATRDEPARCAALIEFASHFSETKETFDQALALAKALSEPYAYVCAVGTLAAHVVGDERRKTFSQVFKVAGTIREGVDRARAMAWVAGKLGGREKQRAVQEALRALEDIPDRYEQPEFVGFASVLPQVVGWKLAWKRRRMLRKALSSAELSRYPNVRRNFLCHLAPHLHGRKVLLDRALAAAEDIKDVWARSEALLAIGPHLPRERQRQLVRRIINDCSESDSGPPLPVLIATIPLMEDNERRALVHHALDRLGLPEYRAGHDHLRSLAPYIKEYADLLPKALQVAKSMSSGRSRIVAAAAVVREAPGLMDHELWTDWFDHAPSERKELLQVIGEFAFGASKLCGPQEIPEIARAVIDIGKWWP